MKSPRSTAFVPFSIRFTAREIEKISTAANSAAKKYMIISSVVRPMMIPKIALMMFDDVEPPK